MLYKHRSNIARSESEFLLRFAPVFTVIKLDHTLIPYRVLVTGSRGKSSVVRLLHAAMTAQNISCYGRITGIVPRELGPIENREIIRSSGAHVEEMRWWLKQLPASARGVVLENSAVNPEFQLLAARWLKPGIIVLTNAVPDHQEVWGPTQECAEEALLKGIPKNSVVVTSAAMAKCRSFVRQLNLRRCTIHFSESPTSCSSPHREKNYYLALATLKVLGLDQPKAISAMKNLKPDTYDFQVLKKNGINFAFAFTANDLGSTKDLFKSLSWKEADTTLLFNHRSDRPERYKSFFSWAFNPEWKNVIVTGHRPSGLMKSASYLKIKSYKELLALFFPGDNVFGCGNVKGIPLDIGLI